MSRKKLHSSETFPGLTERIKVVRGKLGQAEFADLLGVTKATISRYESGLTIPPKSKLEKIAEICNRPLKWVLWGESATPAPPPHLLEHAPEDYAAGLSDLEVAWLTEVITKVKEVIKARRLKLSDAQEARLIVKVYDDCRAAHEHPSQLHVERILLFRD